MSGAGQSPFDRPRIDALVQAAADGLEGDWLLIGGALVALWLEPGRVTLDVDLVSLGGEPAQRYALLDFALRQGLPVEAINSAADFFVRRIAGWREQLEVFRTGARGRIFRPTPTLFLLLKVGRLSERDLADCLVLLERVRQDGLALDRGRVLAAMGSLPGNTDEAAAQRRASLRAALAGP